MSRVMGWYVVNHCVVLHKIIRGSEEGLRMFNHTAGSYTH